MLNELAEIVKFARALDALTGDRLLQTAENVAKLFAASGGDHHKAFKMIHEEIDADADAALAKVRGTPRRSG